MADNAELREKIDGSSGKPVAPDWTSAINKLAENGTNTQRSEKQLADDLGWVQVRDPIADLSAQLHEKGSYDDRAKFLNGIAERNSENRKSNPNLPVISVEETILPDHKILDANLTFANKEKRSLHHEEAPHDIEYVTNQVEKGDGRAVHYLMSHTPDFKNRVALLHQIDDVNAEHRKNDAKLPDVYFDEDIGIGEHNTKMGAYARLGIDPPGWGAVNRIAIYGDSVRRDLGITEFSDYTKHD
jgi:hypothetical protein